MTGATSTRPTGRTHATLRALMRLRGLPTRRDEILIVPACLNQQPGDAPLHDWFLDTDAMYMLRAAKVEARYTGYLPTCEACQALVDVALENPLAMPLYALRWSGWLDFSREWFFERHAEAAFRHEPTEYRAPRGGILVRPA